MTCAVELDNGKAPRLEQHVYTQRDDGVMVSGLGFGTLGFCGDRRRCLGMVEMTDGGKDRMWLVVITTVGRTWRRRQMVMDTDDNITASNSYHTLVYEE